MSVWFVAVSVTLRVHVPKQIYFGPQGTQIGTTLRPKYIYLGTWTLRVMFIRSSKLVSTRVFCEERLEVRLWGWGLQIWGSLRRSPVFNPSPHEPWTLLNPRVSPKKQVAVRSRAYIRDFDRSDTKSSAAVFDIQLLVLPFACLPELL